jgi:hypothetical protein
MIHEIDHYNNEHFLVWFEIIIKFQDKEKNLQGICKFLQIPIYSTMIKKEKWFIGQTLTIFHSKNQLYEKIILGENDM